MSINDRKLEVLRAIVEDYVSTQEPVGSKALVDRHRLGVSAATIRNDMAALEDDGYIHQPHTSAGRVPTTKGYRLFVDRLSTIKPLTAAERRAVHRFLDEAVDLNDVVYRTVRLLAQLTRQVAVVQFPSLSRSSVRHIELVQISDSRVMLVMITDTGRVEQRVLDMPTELSADDVLRIRTLINDKLVGVRLTETSPLITALPSECPPELTSVMTVLAGVMLETLVERGEERIALAGTANLTRHSVDFAGSLRPILEALEEEVVLLKLLGEIDSGTTLHIGIGEENDIAGLAGTSVVSTGYGPLGSIVGGLGVVGPTRMDYPGTIAAVRTVARYVSKILAQS
ncbi:heat-inducible transcriptional repressor HrcA [Stackebrandtia soli]|uniref:heat-inducible transcriptional repressor HrcA n=1 Tax=Stackebrandtia soli TaxID=1892856 RepID=UPI0039E7FC92